MSPLWGEYENLGTYTNARISKYSNYGNDYWQKEFSFDVAQANLL